ncbi:MAG TPA: hypothetical protein ENO09_08810 [bacterium]|nr:hypothetical protein [bacterium]
MLIQINSLAQALAPGTLWDGVWLVLIGVLLTIGLIDPIGLERWKNHLPSIPAGDAVSVLFPSGAPMRRSVRGASRWTASPDAGLWPQPRCLRWSFCLYSRSNSTPAAANASFRRRHKHPTPSFDNHAWAAKHTHSGSALLS